MNYPVADLLIRIKNGYQAHQRVLHMPYSKLRKNLGEILVKESYLKSVKVKEEKTGLKYLEVELKYAKKEPAISGIKIISKPGLRVYRSANLVPRVKTGRGITIISTPQGLMVDKQAKRLKIGGEVICQIL